MPFVANFSGAADTPLTALTPPFTFRCGGDHFEVDGAGAVRREVTGVAQTFYSTGTPSASPSMTSNLPSQNAGLAMFGTVSGGLFSGYFIRPQSNLLSLRLWKVTNGGAPVQLAVSSAVADCNGIEFSAIVSGGNPSFTVKRGTSTILTYTDSSSPFTTGDYGPFAYTTGPLVPGGSSAGWSGYSDNSTSGAAPTLTIDERVDGYPFECIAGPPAISFTGTKLSATGTLERQVETEDGTVVLAWATTGMSAPTSTTWRWDNTTLPYRTDNKDYRLKVREAANTDNMVTQANRWMVGMVIPKNDQSLDDLMATSGKSPSAGARSSVRANPHRVMTAINRQVSGGGGGVTIARLNDVGAYGSGYVTAADEIARWADASGFPNIPICFVNIHVSSQTMTEWNNNITPAGWSWTLLDFMAFMLAQAGGRISALLRSVVVWSSSPAAAITAMNQIVANVEARLPNQPSGYTFPVWVRGGPRATRSAASVLNLRAVCTALGTQGGRYRQLTGPIIDLQMEDGDNLHQATGDPATANNSAAAHIGGNRRLGFREGRGVAAMLQEVFGLPVTIDRFGPQIVSRQFTSSARTAARVTFDRDTKIPDGSTTGIPQFWVSNDNKATWTQLTGVKTGARTYEFPHPSGGDWLGQTVWISYAQDSPWNTTGGAFGGETAATSLLPKLVYDASDFGEGTEMVAVPSEGIVVAAGALPTVLDLTVTVQGGNTIVRQLVINP